MLTLDLETPNNTLLDSSADTNVLPLVVYNHLKNKAPMVTQDVLYSSQNTPFQIHNVANVLVDIDGVSTHVQFQVMDCQVLEKLILGKPWIYKH